MFLERLDRARYLKLQVEIRNGIERGVTPPATLDDMFRIASKREEVEGGDQKGGKYHRL